MKIQSLIIAILLTASASLALAQDGIVDTWRYTQKAPADGWQKVDFDDSSWTEAAGGFGTRNTPAARIGTEWKSNDIWIRKSFELKSIPKNPGLLIHHDEDAQVFINGKEVATFERWTTDYEVVPLDAAAASALKPGVNLMAVHCHQETGGQFIDVHVVDGDNVPRLPKPKRNLTPFNSPLTTTWGEEVTAENAWTEYPRPQLTRAEWTNLNGHWDYAITSADVRQIPQQWTGKILVPFCLESKLGGVQRMLDIGEALWYHRTFMASPKSGHRTLLNFEAVDYRCAVFVNGQKVGEHQGGNNPFSVDATTAIQDGANELVVRVEDETEGFQLRGKQVLNPHGIWYTQVSGIWQTVWLEDVASQYIEDLDITTDAAKGTVTIYSTLGGDGQAKTIRVIVRDGDDKVAESEGNAESVQVIVPAPKLWSTDSPHLYNLEVSLLDADGSLVDQVGSYAGIRTIGKARDADGHLRMTLNGKPIFHLGPLDQGWWPDGLLTPPSDEAMLFDIEFLKSAGFNMIRKHIKIEPRRYYTHCDRLGIMVWQDQVSGGVNPPWTRLDPNPRDADWPPAAHEQYMLEFDRMIDSLDCHPSIVVWTPFNEAWGQHLTTTVGEWAVKRDPSRIINIASGGNFWPVADVVDHHEYPHPAFPFDEARYKDFVQVVGEFGGHGFPVKGHLWEETDAIWGYGDLPKTLDELKNRYRISCEKLADLKSKGIAAGVYTQTTDVETEVYGLMTYDRRVIKIPARELRLFHQLVLDATQHLRETSTR